MSQHKDLPKIYDTELLSTTLYISSIVIDGNQYGTLEDDDWDQYKIRSEDEEIVCVD